MTITAAPFEELDEIPPPMARAAESDAAPKAPHRKTYQNIIDASGLKELPDKPELEAVAECLSKLKAGAVATSGAELALLRAAAVEALKGCKVTGAAKLVDEHLREAKNTPATQDEAQLFAEPDPWPEPVDGARLLAELARSVARHVILPKGAATAIPLWVMHTHALDAAHRSPRLGVTSATKRAGKTTLLEWLRATVRRPLLTSNLTAAVGFRAIEAFGPTLIIDEVDTFLRDNEELRGVLNAGHKRDGMVLRCAGDEHEVKMFRVWGPVAFGGIGRLPDTIADRSILVRMRRKSPGETVKPLRRRQAEALSELQRKAARWAADQMGCLVDAEPEIPVELNDRQADGWEALLAIADAVGGVWPKRAREAAVVLSAATADDGSLGELLVADLHTYFAETGTDRVWSETLTDWLAAIQGRPWAEMGRAAKPMTPNRLARLLKEFEIKPDSVRISDKTKKGYLLEQFADTFTRYLPDHNRNTGT